MDASDLTVLHVLPHVQEIGNGIVDVTVDLAIAQAAAGLSVVVASGGGEYEDLLTRHGVTCIPLTLRPEGLLESRRIVRRLRPSVIHTHTLKGLALARATAGGIPVLNTAHRDLGRWSRGMRMAHRVLAVSDGIAETLGQVMDPARITVVRNGVLGGPRRQPLLDLPAADLRRPSVVFVGGMYTHKGVGVILRAFRRLLDDEPGLGARLYMVGDGPDRAQYQELATTLGIADHVEWAGFRRDAYAYIRGCDVFALPSLEETFGLVLAEAREAGAPIVAAATGGVPEVLEHGRAGHLVPRDDVDAFASALRAVLLDETERIRLGKAASEGLDWLGVDRMHRDVLRAYDSVLETA
ncbi:glycosyltransferase [Blastococcus sp. CT_GayMR20]|uniref:glycosyltransferase n=1 Tax=Blastococcus sp. CT_GayMR20 TaxID=2559609 RepID=UPI0010744219|nr:glycosyltransferase [Blastococcus sp. CT_GayMR20]TFV88387.1 glycosyltransferase [Blastococcus sp. CT_GayMR20]